MFVSFSTRCIFNRSGADGSRNPETKKKIVFPVFLVKLKLQVLEASGDETPPELLHQNMQPKCCYLFNQKERSKGLPIGPIQ